MSISRLLIGAVIALAAAAPAAAGAPNGSGLETATAPCAGGEITVVLTRSARAATSWNLTTDEHVVVKSFDAVFTLTPAGGGPPTVVGTESRTYGVKAGLGPESVCSFSYGYPVEDGSITVDITIVAVPVTTL